jgi:dehydrogenase/reductase SDR family member 1
MDGRIAVVTGASRGVGRGIANELADRGATAFATGRSIREADLVPSVIRVVLDHLDDDAVAGFFERPNGLPRSTSAMCSTASRKPRRTRWAATWPSN